MKHAKPSTALAAEVALLLRAAREPVELDDAGWDRLLRLARMSGLHARVAARNIDNPQLSPRVRRHLLSASRMADFSKQMLLAELRSTHALCDGSFPVLVLKGAAYLLQDRAAAQGRFVSDADLLVPRSHLRTMEERLRAAGWQSAALDPHDERYYRDWSHETPPLRYPGRFLELDLHHAITPVTGSLSFDPQPLFDASEAIPGTPLRALSPPDQVLHACLHCFHDGDFVLRVREVVDIDALLREFSAQAGFWDVLGARARALGLERPLWYGLRYAAAWMQLPVPPQQLAALPAPPALARASMDLLVPRAMLPTDPDHPPGPAARFAQTALLARYHWLRMPLRLLLPHLARKTWRRLRARRNSGVEGFDP